MRTRGRLLLSTLVGFFGVVFAATVSASPFFSLDFVSPSLPAFALTESDVFVNPGPLGGPPALLVPAGGLGLVGVGLDNLNAMSTAAPLVVSLHFSVTRGSVGIAGAAPDVASEAGVGQAAGDVYRTALAGANTLAFNQDGLGEIPPLPPGALTVPPIDSVDALDSAPLPTFFALSPGHPYFGPSGFIGCGGDLFVPVGGGPPGPGLPFGALGLAACGDDVDAMHLDSATGDIYFSLAIGSPSLGIGSPIVGCAGGCSAADIFVAPGAGGVAFVFATAGTLGLAPGDDVDAITWLPAPTPVPSIGSGGLGLLALLVVGEGARRLRWRTRKNRE